MFKKIILTTTLLVLLLISSATHANAQTTVSINPSTQNVTAGEDVTVQVNINSTSTIKAFQINVDFDESILSLTNTQVSDILENTQGNNSNLTQNIIYDDNPGSVSFSSGVVGDPETSYPTGTGTLATLTFTAISSGTSNLTITQAQVRDGSNDPILNPTINNGSVTVSGSAPSPTPTTAPSPSPTSTSQATSVSVLPATQTTSVGSTITHTIQINSTSTIKAFQINVDFDESILSLTNTQISDFLKNTQGSTSNLTQDLIDDDIPGSISFTSAVVGDPETSYPTGTGTLATLTFTAISSGTSNLTITQAEVRDGSNDPILNPTINNGSVVVSGNNPTITQTPIATPTSSPSPTATIAPTPTIQAGPATASFTVHLQGITARTPSPAPQNLTYKFYQGANLVHTFTNKESTSNSQGYYTTNLSNDDSSNPLQAGNYRVCVKGKSNLQRCFPLNQDSNDPNSSCNQSIYLQPITIQTGNNNINLATDCQKLLAGDVNHNNELDIFDFSLISQLYTDISVPVALGTPEDINHDSTISIADWSLLIINYPQTLVLFGDE